MFKVKKGTITQITFEGEFVEGGAVVTVTRADLPQDIQDLIGKKVYLELYVKTIKNWRDKEKYLNELGFNEKDYIS